MRKNMLFALILLLGIAGGVVRAFEVLHVFDPVTGLAEPWHPFTLALYALTLLAALLILIAAAHIPSVRLTSYAKAFSTLSGEYFLIFAIAAGLLIISAIAGILEFIRTPAHSYGPAASNLILALLSLVCAGTVLYLAGKAGNGSAFGAAGVWTLVPVVYSCFLLIITFSERAADPVILDYVYELFATVSVTLAFYYGAGFAFGNSKVRRTIIFSLLAFYFSLVTLVGLAVNSYLSQDALNLHSLFKIFTFAFIAVNFFAYAKILTSNAELSAGHSFAHETAEGNGNTSSH